MDVVNEVSPSSPERMKEMMQPGPDGPIYMVDLLAGDRRASHRGASGSTQH